MRSKREFESHTYDNCNCSVSCGCQFNEPTTHGNCHFAYVGTVVQGHFNDTAPDGRFLMVTTPPELVPREVNVVVNWFEELTARVPIR